MVASRNRPKGARVGPFGLSVLALTLVPTQIGYQDLAALLVRQHDVSQRARAYAMASPFGTIHAATFSFPRPLGTLIPEPPAFRQASLHGGDVTGSLRLDIAPQSEPFPVVNRRLKSDRLTTAPQPLQTEEPPGSTRDLTPGRVKTVSFPRPASSQAIEQSFAPMQEDRDPGLVPSPHGALPPGELQVAEHARPAVDVTADSVLQSEPVAAETDSEADGSDVTAPQSFALASLPPVQVDVPPKQAERFEPPAEAVEAADPIDNLDPLVRVARLYFGGLPVGKNIGPIERWPGEEPILMLPPSADPDLKRTARAPYSSRPEIGGETVAPKGEVTGPDQRPKSPAERLGLSVKDRAKAEKCLAEAVYFESRGEPKRGQIAVAQVVMNRVFSGYYPNNVCEVVYQNAHRYNACQFTFACDSVKDVVNDPPLWKQATEIARDTLDGKVWLEDIGKSTHYHAYWVHPWWVGTMRKLSRIGVHTFYRPKRWGDGADAPQWGPGITAANAGAAKL